MIYEKWGAKFDIKKLQEHLLNHVLPLPPVEQSKSFGGWSVLSSNGSYQDGWHMGHKVIKDQMEGAVLDKELEGIGAKSIMEYKVPTEICHGYLKEVMDTLLPSGLHPRRARITRLTKGLHSSWHRDGPDNRYFVRLHIPIITNPGCIFEAEENGQHESAHMPADGSCYIIKVNRMHQVRNEGTEDRFHLIMDVWDTEGLTKHHRYISDKSQKS